VKAREKLKWYQEYLDIMKFNSQLKEKKEQVRRNFNIIKL
jgi:hypothetical protein